MRRFAVLALAIPLFWTGCEWFTDPDPREDGAWYAEQPGYSYAQPAISGDTVYVATGDGQIIARDVNTGKALWSSSISNHAIEGGNLLHVAGAVIAPVLFDTKAVDARTGQLLWTYTAPLDTVDGGSGPGQVAKIRIAAQDSTVFIPAWGGAVTAVHARTGAVKWRWTPPALPHRFGSEGVIVYDGVVYANVWHFLNYYGTSSEGRIVALDARTGAELWQTILPNESYVCVSGAPAPTSSMVVVTTLNARTYGLHRATGAVKWMRERDGVPDDAAAGSVITGAIASNDTVYADAGNGYLRALDANTGLALWRSRWGGGQFGSEMTLSSRWIYAPDGGYLHIFDRRSGRLVWTRTPPGDPSKQLFSASIGIGSTLVFAPVNGAVWAFPQ